MMATMSVDSLAGYILEELLAYLIRNTGYRLLTDAIQDPRELKNLYNGLNVRGRGALHQVDVLGELLWVPAFTYPLRLMIEAKCRKSKTGTDVVRGMMATLIDVNQKNFPSLDSDKSAPQPKYTYVGAIFSASGFSSPASKLALAHGISLIDLNTPELSDLVQASRESAKNILQPTDARAFASSNVEIVRSVRFTIRERLGTLPPEFAHPTTPESLASPDDPLAKAVNTAFETAELFVGMASGPYILVLRAEDPAQFLRYVLDRPTHDVSIHWSRRDSSGRTWFIVPIDRPNAYKLWFKLPEQLVTWIFNSESARKTALLAKEQLLSNISIYRRSESRDTLIRLRYAPQGLLKEQSVAQ
jgi:hypothetical protein